MYIVYIIKSPCIIHMVLQWDLLLHSVQCTVYSVQYTVYNVHRTVCTIYTGQDNTGKLTTAVIQD